MKNILIILSIICLTDSAISQNFLPAFDLFSKNKPTYITLKDGTKIEGEIVDLDRRKGLIEEITLKTSNGKKQEFEPAQILEMYLPPSEWDKLSKMDNALTNLKAYSGEIDMNHISNGYAYFMSTEVQIKKEKEFLLMQLVNPNFSSKVKVFHDPYASETASFGVGAVTVVGGDDKSYYVQQGTETAYKLKKKNYEEAFDKLFESCPEFTSKLKRKAVWSDFDIHLYQCTTGLSPKKPKK